MTLKESIEMRLITEERMRSWGWIQVGESCVDIHVVEM